MTSLDAALTAFDPDQLVQPAYHIVGGARLTGSLPEVPVLRPSDLRVAGGLRPADAALVGAAVGCAATARRSSDWACRDPRQRGNLLRAIGDRISERAAELALLEAWSSTRLIAETLPRDVFRAAEIFRYYGEQADKIEGTITATQAEATCLIMPEPYGVVAAIVPWNFPLINAAMKVAPALAAGNAVVLKPSELTPFSAARLAEIAVEAGLPKGLFNVVQGGAATGEALVSHPDVAKITFTGSTATGQRIMQLAAANDTRPVTLELGGKSPLLVLPDVTDLERLAPMIANAFCYNGGQVCTAGTRLILPRRSADQLLELVIAATQRFRPGPSWEQSTTLSPLVSEGHADRVQRLMRATVAAGAVVRSGGEPFRPGQGGVFYRPTILEDVARDSPGHLQEFFAPVTVVYSYDDLDEGLALTAHPTYALAASIHTSNAGLALTLPSRIEAGMVWVNCHGRAPENTAPQGGFKGSGFGKDMGRAGLEGYLRHKTIWHAHA